MLYVGKEDKVYGQLYRGYASIGTLVPFSKRAPVRAHRCFSIIAQDFSPGWPCVPAWLWLEEEISRPGLLFGYVL